MEEESEKDILNECRDTWARPERKKHTQKWMFPVGNNLIKLLCKME